MVCNVAGFPGSVSLPVSPGSSAAEISYVLIGGSGFFLDHQASGSEVILMTSRPEIFIGYAPFLLGIWSLAVTLLSLILLARTEIRSRRGAILRNGWLILWFCPGLYVAGRSAEAASELFLRVLPTEVYSPIWLGYCMTITFFCFLFPPYIAWGFLAMFKPSAVRALHARFARANRQKLTNQKRRW